MLNTTIMVVYYLVCIIREKSIDFSRQYDVNPE